MSAEIIPFPGVTDFTKPRELQPVQDVVEQLEDLLERAKAGEIRSFVFAAENPGDGVATAYSPKMPTFRERKDMVTLASMIEFRVMHDFDATYAEIPPDSPDAA